MKKLFASLFFSLFLMVGYSQNSPFKSLPKANTADKKLELNLAPSGSTWQWRFIANVAGYQYPGNQVVTGAGFGYQNLSYNDTTQKYYCNFSVSGMLWAGGSLQPSLFPPSNVISYGVELGILNNLIMGGAAINNGKIVAIISIGISLNN